MPKKSSDQLLIETATTVRIMNERLFGGVGQADGGALHFIMNQHRELADTLNKNKQELLDKIDATKQATEAEIDKVKDTYTILDRKVTRWSGALAAFEFVIMTGLTWMGIHYHGRG